MYYRLHTAKGILYWCYLQFYISVIIERLYALYEIQYPLWYLYKYVRKCIVKLAVWGRTRGDMGWCCGRVWGHGCTAPLSGVWDYVIRLEKYYWVCISTVCMYKWCTKLSIWMISGHVLICQRPQWRRSAKKIGRKLQFLFIPRSEKQKKRGEGWRRRKIGASMYNALRK